MLHRHSALATAAAILGTAFAGSVVLPQAAAAQVYEPPGPRPYMLHTQDDVEFDQGHARFDHRQEFDDGPRGRPEFNPHHRPAEYDDRDRNFAGDGWRRPAHGDPRWWDRGDHRPGYGVRFEPPYAPGFPERPYGVGPFEEVAEPVAPPVFDGYRGSPDVGCTIQRAETTTAVGWRKIVTHKTCYRR